MLKSLRQSMVHYLWQQYRSKAPHIQLIEKKLAQRGVQTLVLDHFAVIDLPGPYTGIPVLSQLFAAMGYRTQGRDYLADKQNDFLWMTEEDSETCNAKTVLPQVVVADFRLAEMPGHIRKIIEKYAGQARPLPVRDIVPLVQKACQDKAAAQQLQLLLSQYFEGREWPLPTYKEFRAVQEFNELLAWVLVFGRRPNHFTLSAHLLGHFKDLASFCQFIEKEVGLVLNHEGGTIKGGEKTGIAQGSTKGTLERAHLADSTVKLPIGFVEFVWRFPKKSAPFNGPLLWDDYFTGFVPQHADRVIESLYVRSGQQKGM